MTEDAIDGLIEMAEIEVDLDLSRSETVDFLLATLGSDD